MRKLFIIVAICNIVLLGVVILDTVRNWEHGKSGNVPQTDTALISGHPKLGTVPKKVEVPKEETKPRPAPSMRVIPVRSYSSIRLSDGRRCASVDGVPVYVGDDYRFGRWLVLLPDRALVLTLGGVAMVVPTGGEHGSNGQLHVGSGPVRGSQRDMDPDTSGGAGSVEGGSEENHGSKQRGGKGVETLATLLGNKGR